MKRYTWKVEFSSREKFGEAIDNNWIEAPLRACGLATTDANYYQISDRSATENRRLKPGAAMANGV